MQTSFDDISLKPFHWEPIPASDYGIRFNQALDSGALYISNLSLPERISINQQMENRSIEYIDSESGSLTQRERMLTLEQLFGVHSTGQWKFHTTHYGKGKNTLLLVGNSHADQIERELRIEWQDHYSTFNSFTIGGKPKQILLQL